MEHPIAINMNTPLPLPSNMIRPSFLATETQVVMEDRKRKQINSDSQEVNTMPLRKRLSRGASCVSTSSDEDSASAHLINEDDNHRNHIRKKILAHIENRLDNDAACRKSLAKVLESNLYNNAHHFDEYADVSTLHERIRLSALAIMSRRRLKKVQKRSRRQILHKTLGEQKYQVVCDLVKAVQDLRAQGAQSFRCTTNCETKIVIAGQRTMPSAVRNLFFNTQIVVATESTPLDQIELEKWDAMINEARANIEAFQEWSGLRTKYYATW